MPTNGDVLTAIGWGDTNTDDMLFAPSEELREVDVDYIPNGECEESEGCIGDWCESYNGLIFGAMLCASSPGKDGCQGDSGEMTRVDTTCCWGFSVFRTTCISLLLFSRQEDQSYSQEEKQKTTFKLDSQVGELAVRHLPSLVFTQEYHRSTSG